MPGSDPGAYRGLYVGPNLSGPNRGLNPKSLTRSSAQEFTQAGLHGLLGLRATSWGQPAIAARLPQQALRQNGVRHHIGRPAHKINAESRQARIGPPTPDHEMLPRHELESLNH